jgi:tetratricopeptide (TPR) repeat protein
MAVAISPDGSTLLTGSYDKTAQRWDSTTGEPLGPALQHEDRVSVVAFSPDGKTIMTGGEDRMVRLWDAGTGTLLGQPIPQSGTVDAGAFSPDGKSFVAGCDNGSAQVWDLASRTPLGQPFLHPGCISAAAFSPDGKTLLTGCEDAAARLWDVETRTLRMAPLPHQAWIWAVAFSPDGKTILTGSRDKKARLWDAATGVPLGPPIPHPHQVFTVAFSPDGNNLLTGDYFYVARLFRKVPELPDDLERVATWVEVVTGLTLDAGQGTIQVLDNEGWRKRREQLEERGGSPENTNGPRLDPILYGPDPRARGRGLMERGQWEDAEAAFNELVRARPYNASTWIELSRFHITRGQPERAIADFDLAIPLHPENLRMRHCQALTLLSQGDQAGLRQVCSDLLGRHGNMTDPQTSNSITRSCVLGPDSVADREAPVRLAEAALEGFPTDEKSAAMNTLGAALYRAGRFEASIRCLEEGIQKREGTSLPQDWVFLALAHDRLGHRAEALRWLDRFQTYKASAHPDAFWNDLEVRLLRREAEARILLDPIFPSDPFIH